MTTETTKPDFIDVHLFDDKTGAYTHSAQAQRNPMFGVAKDEPEFLTPVHSMLQAPSEPPPGQWPVAVNGVWVNKPDHRGKMIYNQTDNSAKTMDVVGDPPEGWALEPAHQFQLEEAETDAKRRVHDSRAAVVSADVHVTIGDKSYPFQADDYSFMILSRTVQLVERNAMKCPPIWRSSDNQNVPVTVEDLQAIEVAIMTQLQQAFMHAFTLKDQIKAAADADNLSALRGIQW